MSKKTFILVLIGIFISSFFSLTTSRAVEKPGYVVLALTDEELQIVEPFATEKEQEGFEVSRLSMQKEKLKTSLEIRNFLQNKFKVKSFQHVFFGGDVPIEELDYKIYNRSQNISYHVHHFSDFYFSLDNLRKPLEANSLFSVGRIPSDVLANWIRNRQNLKNISKIVLASPVALYETDRDAGGYWLRIDPSIETNDFKLSMVKKYDHLKITTLFETEGYAPSDNMPDYPLNESNFDKEVVNSDVVIAVSTKGPINGEGSGPIVNGKVVNYTNLKRAVWAKKIGNRPSMEEIEIIDYCKDAKKGPKLWFLSTTRPLENKSTELYPTIDFLSSVLSNGCNVVLGNGALDQNSRTTFSSVATTILGSDNIGSLYKTFTDQKILLPQAFLTIIYGDSSQRISFEKVQEEKKINIDLNFQRSWSISFNGDVTFKNLPSNFSFTKSGSNITFTINAPAVYFTNKPLFLDYRISFSYSDQKDKGVISVKYRVFNFGSFLGNKKDS